MKMKHLPNIIKEINNPKQNFIEWLLSTETPGMHGLINYMETNGFFKAPCSASHHLNCDEGLLWHSLSVLLFSVRLYVNYDLPIPLNSIIKCAALHDIFKMFLYQKRHGKWQYKDDGTKGKISKSHSNTKLHGKWAIDIITSFIKLTDQEKEMILWHMGPFTEYYDNHKPGDFLEWASQKDNPNKNAALFLYFCDHFSSMFLED